VPWRQIRGAGNVYRHDHGEVLESLLWTTVKEELGPLEAAVLAEPARFPEGEPC
jgi:uncharacterized protein with HEPN domain